MRGTRGGENRSGGGRGSERADEEFRDAMHLYQNSSGRMFPTWSEVLEVLRTQGYRKADGEAVSTESR